MRAGLHTGVFAEGEELMFKVVVVCVPSTYIGGLHGDF